MAVWLSGSLMKCCLCADITDERALSVQSDDDSDDDDITDDRELSVQRARSRQS